MIFITKYLAKPTHYVMIIKAMLDKPEQASELLQFFEKSTLLKFKKGDIIIRPEDSPSGVFFIKQGFVKAYSITKYGEENLLIIRKDPDFFPLIWAFTGEHREISYEAMSDCTLYRSSRSHFQTFVDDNPAILPFMLSTAIEAYRLHSQRVNTLSYRTVRERVMSFLLYCSERFGNQTEQGVLISAPLRQQDIASSINATRESTSRELSLLFKKGLIVINHDHSIVIVDKKAIKEFL